MTQPEYSRFRRVPLYGDRGSVLPLPGRAQMSVHGFPLRSVVRLLRPQQWTKNVFVLFPLVFSESLLDLEALRLALLAMLLFSLLSSAVYVVNDILDREADLRHPRKRLRPIASGEVSVAAGWVLAGLLILAVVCGTLLWLPATFLVYAGLFAANSLLYCVYLKHKVIADVMGIATGFILRILAGSAAIAVPSSSWILVCGFALALVLGFGKRRSELVNLGHNTGHRATLESYDVPKVDTLLGISAAIALLAYMLYTVAPETVRRHRTENLILTVPLVAYGLFRYLFKAQEGNGDGPTEMLMRDWVFPAIGVLWILLVAGILYWR